MLTIAEAAQEAGRPYLSFYRLVMGLHKQHGGEWLQRPDKGEDRKTGRREWRINMSLFATSHPEFFEKRFLSRDEAEVILERIAELDTHLQDEVARRRKDAARIRALEMRLNEMEAKLKAVASVHDQRDHGKPQANEEGYPRQPQERPL
jgi:hypothetical protein